MNDKAYQAVLDFFRSSVRDERLLDASSPLPPSFTQMLKTAAEIADKQPPEAKPGQGEALREAVTQFAERALFSDQANYYRILGLNRDADTAQIKDHYKWLSSLLFPVADVMHWNEADSQLLNRAYSVLRDPRYRKSYNEEFFNKSAVEKTVEAKSGTSAAGEAFHHQNPDHAFTRCSA